MINLLLFGPKVEKTRLLRGNDKWQEPLSLPARLEQTRVTSGTSGTDSSKKEWLIFISFFIGTTLFFFFLCFFYVSFIHSW